ncbi:MAG TPA: T9SS type A sorting domain-containing protein [bacterium]
MKKLWITFVPLVLAVLLTVLTCAATENNGLCRITATPTVSHARPSLDSPQPDSLFYDNGEVQAFYTSPNLWTRIRFTAPYNLELRSLYFVANNPNNVANPCSVYVYANNNGNPGLLMQAFRMPGSVVHFGNDLQFPVWNDFDLPAPLAFGASEDFFVVMGPQVGGPQNQGWQFLLNFAPQSDRYAIGTAGHNGAFTPAGGNFLIRAGVAPIEGPNRGYVSLISTSPHEWHYQLNHVGGIIRRFSFSPVCHGTVGSVTGDAQLANWSVTSHGDSIIFSSPFAMVGNSLATFVLTNALCNDEVHWRVGDSTGVVDGPWPVELTAFTAEPVEEAVQLRLVTASEHGNQYFEIYRAESADGNYAKIAQLASQGNSATEQTYSYQDNTVEPGRTYWYYLADVSISGERTLHRDLVRSASAGRSALIHDYALAAYPNPFNPTTTLDLSLPEAQRVSVKVFDLTGKLVRTLADAPYAAGRHQIAFDAGSLPSGIYIAQLQAGSVNLTQKLLLVK